MGRQTLGAALAAVLLLAMYPEAQKKAQKEIDDVVGFGRLPDFNDRPELVYVTAFIKEVFRLHPVLPTGQIPILDVHRDWRS